MRFKIKTDDVRKAAKKNGLKICNGGYYFRDNNKQEKPIIEACAIGQLYTASTGNKDGCRAAHWADRKFGKVYKKGFIAGFDEREIENILSYNPNYRNNINFITGYRNGQLLRRTLIDKQNKENKKN